MPTTQKMDKIKVRWRIENKEAKGTIIEDAGNRTKIVFLDHHFRGRLPQAGETTEAEVSRDTQPAERGRGALIVRPIYAPDPKALSLDEARVKLEEMARVATAKQYVFACEVVIEVESLPGWKGQLIGRRSEKLHQNDGQLCMYWYFQGQNGHTVTVWDTSTPYFIITPGIQWKKGYAYWAVTNWTQAVADLGMPVSVEREEHSYRYRITWRDHQGLRFTAEASEREVEAFKNPPFPHQPPKIG